jgi:hypothetical protein
VLEFVWEGLFSIWRIFVVLTIITIIGVPLGALYAWWAQPPEPRTATRPWYRDDDEVR